MEKEQAFLDGVVTLNSEREKTVSYYSLSNRGIGEMKVWVPVSN
jgi:hypothetical protein